MLLDWLFPKECVGCGEWGNYLCEDCVNKLIEIRNHICPMCGKSSLYGMSHTQCRHPWGMEGLVGVMEYKGLMKRIIRKFKYKLVRELVKVVVELIITSSEIGYISRFKWLVTGVPLHKNKWRLRGFNQSDEIAKVLAEAWGFEVETKVVTRVMETQPQMSLVGEERKKNVAKAFDDGEQIGRVYGKRVLLIDDVWTTGATMRECAKVIKRAGAKEVWGLVAAR